ncbi:MAG: 7-dehydrocholesterol reductase [Myxococcota bacterium]
MRTLIRTTIIPLLLLLCCSPFAILIWYTNVHLDGAITALGSQLIEQGLITGIWNIWRPYFFGSSMAWSILGIYAVVQIIFMRVLPGRTVSGPMTPTGHVPVYKANGVAAFVCTYGLFIAGSLCGLYSLAILYDNFGGLLGALNLFSLVFCLFLCLKGLYFPSTADSGSSGYPVLDYFWGTELYPRLFGVDVKMFTNCRFGMMSWGLLVISFAAKQHEVYGLSDSMLVSAILQLAYVVRFFTGEAYYLRTTDIMHDRAGYYLCWGCLVWVPAVYTSPALFLVNHPNHLGLFWSAAILLGGLCVQLITLSADKQKERVRKTDGNCLVWGKPPKLIRTKTSLLLASGWWSVSRHFHYLPEITGTFLWTVPALFTHYLPYFYLTFLTILLLDRVYRQEKRCQAKYGDFWATYCKAVPQKLLPKVW